MKKLIYLSILLFAAVACTQSDGSIIGTASADDGNVLDGITVKLYNQDIEMVTETTTDAEGNFVFTELDEGNYYIAATITVGGDVWDTGNTQQIVYVNDDIVKEVALNLSLKE